MQRTTQGITLQEAGGTMQGVAGGGFGGDWFGEWSDGVGGAQLCVLSAFFVFLLHNCFGDV